MAPLKRRDFCLGLGASAGLTACAPLGCGSTRPARLPDARPPATMALTRHGEGDAAVVEVRWDRAVDPAGKVDGEAVARMLDAALARLRGSDAAAAYRQWAGASHRVSIKVNAIKSQAFAHPELAGALAKGLVGAGADPARVTVWDRDTSGLQARGYLLDQSPAALGYRCLGSDAVEAEAKQPRSATIDGKHKVYFSPLLTGADVLVNVAALKDHSMAGVTLTLKNNFGVIRGAERLHGNVAAGAACEPGISELAAHDEIRGRLQLCVIDALVGVCEGGPGEAEPSHAFRYGGLLVAADPVAIDRRGLAIIEARRKTLGLVPLAERQRPNPSPPIHIDRAAERLS